MKAISFIDGVVYFGIVGVSLLCHLSCLETCSLIVSILWNVSYILGQILWYSVFNGGTGVHNYRKISNPLQQLIIDVLGYAFNEVDYKIGRLFFSEKNLTLFLRWRLTRLPFVTLDIKLNNGKCSLKVYKFAGDIVDTNAKSFLLYIHGGGLIVGSVPFYAEFLGLLQSRLPDTIIFSPEYSLVPEAVYPTQLDEVAALFEHIAEAYPSCKIILGGDSAGGLLCQSLLLRLQNTHQGRKVHLAFLISPWLDVGCTFQRRQGRGDYISPSAAAKYGGWYSQELTTRASLETEDSHTPPANPLSWTHAMIADCVPEGGLYITCGGAETLRSDSERLVSIITKDSAKQNQKVVFHVEENEVHAYVLINLYLRRGTRRLQSLDRIVAFIKSSH